ncbi:hypothetical protein [Nitratireductor thuwali]|uniref:Uncharacterized protein n=1 Tax=Nitratireductor thuwali TaxID=2267699 RepID=A0ABY5MUH0_9HYPH|nr:hypothetical protein NTH_03984 [Nitratireductor thuwali]
MTVRADHPLNTAHDIADPYEPAADEIIEACGGDAREAVKALLGANEYLEGRVRVLEASVSWGYVRASVQASQRKRQS